ncbi:MAG: type IV pilus modification protein PilV [Rhodocyclaceae bacterium]|nr:type IV pilus modification protein PilV [Rhodocyclaceae bacterium]
MRKELGFSLLEAMISMFVIMFGVLGLSGLQMLAINNTEMARYQSLATMMASSMATSMQANVAYWGTPPPTIMVNRSSISGGPPSFTGTCAGSVCSAPQMAYYDLSNWGMALSSNLPSGQATIQCSQSSTPAICTMTLSWSEKNIALHNPTSGASGMLATGTASTHSYQTLVSMRQ